jgi:predicted DCC family thiol-disulfide oxidoreductase YuxK
MKISNAIAKVLPADAVKRPTIIYDGDCPFCSNYVALFRVREAIGPVALLNAREHPQLVDAVRREQLDINEGMVFLYAGELYHGADAMNAMALLGSGSGTFNRINAAIFRNPKLARRLYPFLRLGRNATLWLLRRKKITHG